MTLRAIPRSRLDRLVPRLLREAALVILVPVSDDDAWAADAAWAVARAAATFGPGGRRSVALVDLRLAAPLLHRSRELAAAPGIADAFISDGPLSDVAQEVDGVHFLAAGTAPSDPSAIVAATRWRRLQAGFRSEGALLLVVLPAEGLAAFGAKPDGVLALSPGGVDLGSPAGRALLAARDRGIALLGAVRERWTAPSAPALHAARESRRVRSTVTAVATALAIIGTVLILSPHGASSGIRGAARPPLNHETFGTAQAPLAAESLFAADSSLPALSPGDSGGWTLQLAAYGAPERAQKHVKRLAAAGIPAFVSPLAPDVSGIVWYRVLAGAYADRAAATRARAGLWADGLAVRGAGTPLLVPYSLVLAHSADAGRLRAAGLVGIRWGTRGAVLVGAFEQPEQAGIAASELRRLGIATTLVTRTDPIP